MRMTPDGYGISLGCDENILRLLRMVADFMTILKIFMVCRL